MHKIVKFIFETLINIEKALRIICVFFIMMISLYWIQNLIGASWWWMGFFAPVLDSILDFVNNIYSFSFDFWNKAIEIKYFNALILIVGIIFALKGLNILIEKAYDLYDDAHRIYKKNTENQFNNNLQDKIKNEEKKVNNYNVYIQTRISKRYLNKSIPFNLSEHNKQMNKFITEKTNAVYTDNWQGFVYSFYNFEKIDDILDILFTILKTEAPVDFIMCIQIGDNNINLKKLIELQEWGKIIMSADTLCRYEYNNVKQYKTSCVGIFQRSSDTLEVHEFVKKL